MAKGRKTKIQIMLTSEQQEVLEAWQRKGTLPARLSRRGRIILLLTQGKPVSEVSRLVGIGRRKAYKWVYRFQEKGIAGLYDKTGRGRKSFFPSRSRHLSDQARVRATG